jgi:DNA topoisomerase-1
MVKALEEAGVGRPSTYAPTIKLLLERGYASKKVRARAGRAFDRG